VAGGTVPLVGRLRLSEVVAAGHSFGAVTAMVAAEVRAPTPTHLTGDLTRIARIGIRVGDEHATISPRPSPTS
jgi:hypothetical protein